MTDVLPAVVLVSATPSQGTCSGTTTITCNLGPVGGNGAMTGLFLGRVQFDRAAAAQHGLDQSQRDAQQQQRR